MNNILEIRDLVVSYGGIEAVKGISLDVEQGKIVTLIGANGAGKSTTLKEREWQLAGTLSGGEQQMLAVGRALMSNPKLIMMDEPSLGLAPLVVKGIFDIIETVNADGITVLLNEQNANMALKVADKGYVLETGSITMEGTGAELLENEEIKEAYLGKKKA